jgi:hypothetical protein
MIAAAEAAYIGLAVRATARFARRRRARRREPLRVNLMVPPHDAPIGLEERLELVCRQRCPGCHIVFGLHRHGGPAKPIVERPVAEHPEIDITLAVDETMSGSNSTNCSLADTYPAAKHDIVNRDVPVRRTRRGQRTPVVAGSLTMTTSQV